MASAKQEAAAGDMSIDQPTRDEGTQAQDSASIRVFKIFELAEMILADLSLKDTTNAQATCRTMRDLIFSSKKIGRSFEPWIIPEDDGRLCKNSFSDAAYAIAPHFDNTFSPFPLPYFSMLSPACRGFSDNVMRVEYSTTSSVTPRKSGALAPRLERGHDELWKDVKITVPGWKVLVTLFDGKRRYWGSWFLTHDDTLEDLHKRLCETAPKVDGVH